MTDPNGLALTADDLEECWEIAGNMSLDPSPFDQSCFMRTRLEYNGAKDRLVQFARAIEVRMRRYLAEEQAAYIRNLQHRGGESP